MENLHSVLHAKIHRARVTHADINYEGSVTIPPALLAAAQIHEYEEVHIWNVTGGTRFQTYAISGLGGSRDIAINGAAARLVAVGDVIIIACFKLIPAGELAAYRPRLVFVDDNNEIVYRDKEVPGPLIKS